jgi:glycosyltransferase involved in cell wall biosynthesis
MYRPDPIYLEKQLRSLEGQDYDEIEVLIRDDDPASEFQTDVLEKIFQKKKYRYIKGTENLGYGGSFERLTELAEGTYLAYCDQDDIWRKDKISCCVKKLQEGHVLVTSDRAIIDGEDHVVEASYRADHHDVCDTWKTGDSITARAIFTTFAIGMNIVVRSDVAKKLLPLPKNTAHDKWITAGASVYGSVAFIPDTLVSYRRHGANVSGVLKNMTCKQDYYAKRVDYNYGLAQEFVKRFPQIPVEEKKRIRDFAIARKRKKVGKMYAMRDMAPTIIKFEIMLKFVPEWAFRLGLRLLKKRV